MEELTTAFGDALAILRGWAAPEVMVMLDVAVLAALTGAIAVGLRVIRKLNVLYAARSEWAAELAEFSKRADAAEEGLSRMRALLLAEAERRQTERAAAEAAAAAERQPAERAPTRRPPPAPARTPTPDRAVPKAPKPAPAVGRSAGGVDAIMSMQ